MVVNGLPIGVLVFASGSTASGYQQYKNFFRPRLLLAERTNFVEIPKLEQELGCATLPSANTRTPIPQYTFMPYILGKKIEMTQVFEKNTVVPVTLVAVEACTITQIKTKEIDGYEAVQLGLEKKKAIRVKKSEKGKEYKYLREFRVAFASEASAPKIGEQIDLSAFQVGDKVRVSGISKGKGFQGAVKRWGFHGRNATHGVKHEHRTLGSVGSTDAARVFPGKKMPGRMGGDRVSVKNLMIMKIDAENNILAIKGAIPGRRGTLLEIISN